MTILPKKKVQKDRSEGDQHGESPRSPSNHSTSEVRMSLHNHPHSSYAAAKHQRDSCHQREDKYDHGGRYDEYPYELDSSVSRYKKRQRTSPHRNPRKQRHIERSKSHSAYSSPSQVHRGYHTLSSVPAVEHCPPKKELEEGHNSDDEHLESRRFFENLSAQQLGQMEQQFEDILRKKNLTIKRMHSDGACLFRAFADQIFGDQEMHAVIRKHCIDYMAQNADHFQMFITEDFPSYLNRKSDEHCHGNHVEIQALCELYNRPVEVYQYSADPINTFQSVYQTQDPPIRLSYHEGVHYNSIVDPYKATIGVGLGLPGYQPGAADKNLMKDAAKKSEELHIEQAMLEDKIRETDWEITQQSIEEQVARESYLQWLQDQEKRKRPRKSATATCTSSSARNSPTCDFSDSLPHGSKGSRSPYYQLENELFVATTSASGCAGKSSPQPSTSGGAAGGAECKTHDSPKDNFDPALYAFADWNENDIMAHVIAQSQQDYLDSLKKAAAANKHTADSTDSEDDTDKIKYYYTYKNKDGDLC